MVRKFFKSQEAYKKQQIKKKRQRRMNTINRIRDEFAAGKKYQGRLEQEHLTELSKISTKLSMKLEKVNEASKPEVEEKVAFNPSYLRFGGSDK